MRPSLDVRTLLGGAALAAMLVMTGPGVQVTRADGPVSAVPIESGPACDAPPADTTKQIADYVATVQAEAAARQAAGETPEIVVLNNRGFNYRAADDDLAAALARQLDQIHRDTLGK